jgi:hypothetical protein
MHGYVKLMTGTFLFCEGTYQSVLGPLLLLLYRGHIVTQGTRGDLDLHWDSSEVLSLNYSYCFISIELKC